MHPSEWGGDLELCLLTTGLKQDIIVIKSIDNNSEGNYARQSIDEISLWEHQTTVV